MRTEVKKVLKSWESSLKHYSKLDSWKMEMSLSVLGEYLRTKEDTNKIRNLVRQIRDKALCPSFDCFAMTALLKEVFERLEAPKENAVCFMAKRGSRRVKKEGQEFRFKGQTQKLFEERLKFKGGMLLRNFDIETESALESRKVRRIVEKRMCQAFHRMNKKNSDSDQSNSNRYWEHRATSFQLYNIGQVENVRNVSRGESTHWKRMYDPQTGKVVFKKKMAYPNEEAALEAIRLWKVEHPEEKREMQAYKCSLCHKWHIGHSSDIYKMEQKEVAIAC